MWHSSPCSTRKAASKYHCVRVLEQEMLMLISPSAEQCYGWAIKSPGILILVWKVMGPFQLCHFFKNTHFHAQHKDKLLRVRNKLETTWWPRDLELTQKRHCQNGQRSSRMAHIGHTEGPDLTWTQAGTHPEHLLSTCPVYSFILALDSYGRWTHSDQTTLGTLVSPAPKITGKKHSHISSSGLILDRIYGQSWTNTRPV